MREHEFLVLALLFVVPVLPIFALRPDLRRRMGEGALFGLPFALSERFFYPTYWSPRFLFDLIDVLGFGIEDLIFVAALGAFATTVYPAAFGRSIQPEAAVPRGRLLPWALGVLASAIALWALGVPMIFAAVGVQALVALGVVTVRADLRVPMLLGALAFTLSYAAICLAFAQLIPGVFERVWHTEGLIHRAIAGVPIEELAYAFASGALGTAIFPFARRERFSPRRTSRATGAHP